MSLQLLNAAHAVVNEFGNLSLGNSGVADAVADATHKYAKGDIFVVVPPASLVSTTDPALTRIGAASYKKTLVASTTHNVLIPLKGGLLRTFSGTAGVTANPHGIKVRSLALCYRVNTTTITSLTLKVYTFDLTAQASVPTATEQTSTTAGDTLTAAANQYLAIATVTTPTFVNTLDNGFVGEAVIVTPGSSTVDLLGAVWRLSVALY